MRRVATVLARVVDPVCGMEIDPATAAHRAEHKGSFYYFCSAHCVEAFRRKPQDRRGAARSHAAQGAAPRSGRNRQEAPCRTPGGSRRALPVLRPAAQPPHRRGGDEPEFPVRGRKRPASARRTNLGGRRAMRKE